MSAGACPLPGELLAYADGAGPGPAGTRDERARVEAHAAGCADCRRTLAALGLLVAAESAEEKALLDRLAPPRGAAEILREAARRAEPAPSAQLAEPSGAPAGRLSVGPSEEHPADPPRPAVAPPPALQAAPLPSDGKRARPRWARLSAIAGVSAAAAAALLVAWHPNRSADALASAQDGARPLEAAFSDLPYAPYRPQRGAGIGAEARFDRPLRVLLDAKEKMRPGAARLLATLYAIRRGPGDVARAEQLLAEAGGGADAENDRAVLLFGKGDLLAALESVERALELEPHHRAARFNRALLLARLGFDAAGAEDFEALAHDDPGSPWAGEARERAGRLRAPAPRGAEPAERRRDALIALLSADSAQTLAAARAQIAALPAGVASDLARLGAAAARFSSAQLAAHGKLFARYQAVRAEVSAGHASAKATQDLLDDAAGDPLVLVPALQLAAFRNYWRGDLREAQALHLRALHLCRADGCDAVSEAISDDELAETAARDRDFSSAHRLQDRAEALFVSVAAELQLGELQQKRARLLLAEGRFGEASDAAILALRTLAPLRDPSAVAARATAAMSAAGVASARHLLRAELALHQAGLTLLAGTDAADLLAELVSRVALDEADLGRLAEVKALLHAQLGPLLAGGHATLAGQVRKTAAALELRQGDAADALEDATQGLAELAEKKVVAWSDEVAQLRILRARSLLAVRGDAAAAEARAELQAAVDSAVEEARATSDVDAPLLLARRGARAAVELAALGARTGSPAAELLAPLDALRESVFHAQVKLDKAPLPSDWPASLAPHSCLLALLPADDSLVRLALTPASSEAKALSTSRAQLEQLVAAARSSRPAGAVADARAPTSAEQALAAALFAGLSPDCLAASALWLWVEPPLDAVDLSALPLPGALDDRAAVGFVTSLSRLLAPEPPWPPRAGAALLVDGAEVSGDEGDSLAVLPGATRERDALDAALGGGLVELTGARLTPDALLARFPSIDLLHAAVHGSAASSADGGEGSLQLSGELGRLRTREIAAAHLPAGARVVLSACHAAPGESGLAVAFARAGALEVASAEGAIDDAAAARWAESFYPALARGLSFAEANREALRKEPDEGPRAWFVVSK